VELCFCLLVPASYPIWCDRPLERDLMSKGGSFRVTRKREE